MAGSRGTSVNARTYRPRRNQPRRYPGSDLTRYVCHHHDYVYYPVAWESEGTSYAAGYYDEDGNHYDSVLIKDEQTICKCEYCGSSVKIKWEGGAMPNCPNCGAPLSAQATDENGSQTGTEGTANTGGKKKPSKAKIVLRILLAVFLLQFIWGLISVWNEEKAVGVQEVTTTGQDTEPAEPYPVDGGDSDVEWAEPAEPYPAGGDSDAEWVEPEEVYVDALGRYCPLGSDGNYYDSETGTYFWFNTDVTPPQWQYWVEGISDDYGDYGWMEYDDAEQQWYIESEDGWDVLPADYDAAALWHFENANEFP